MYPLHHKVKRLFYAVVLLFLSVIAHAQSIPFIPLTPNVTSLEYFIDNDPGIGNGTAVSVTPAQLATVSPAINTATLSTGLHRLYFRAKDATGRWGIAQYTMFSVMPSPSLFPVHSPAQNITAAEYFIDTDPGYGNASPIAVAPDTIITLQNASANVAGLPNGIHTIYFRVKSGKRWSQVSGQSFIVQSLNTNLIPPHSAPRHINLLEYFFDTDPGLGNGTLVSVPDTALLENLSITANVSALQTGIMHTMFIRTLSGRVSMTTARTFGKGTSPLPVYWISFSAAALQSVIKLNWIVAQEKDNIDFVIERSTNAIDFKPIGQVAGGGTFATEHSYSFTDDQPLQGRNYYRLKQLNASGSFTYSPIVHAQIASLANISINNPATDELIVRSTIDLPSDCAFLIKDMQGRVVSSSTGDNSHKIVINIANLPSANYVLQYSINGEQNATRFIKQ